MDIKCKDRHQLDLLCDWIETGYPTGSRVIGGARKDSDYDFVRTFHDTRDFFESIGLNLDEHPNNYADSLRFFSFHYRREFTDNWLNLIVVEDETDLKAWKHATENVTPIKNSVERKKAFGVLLDEFYVKIGLRSRAIHKKHDKEKYETKETKCHRKRRAGEMKNQLPQKCTVREIALFFGLTQRIVRRRIKKAGILPSEGWKKDSKTGPPSRQFDVFDVIPLFTKNIKKRRKWDCFYYDKCLNKAALGPNGEKWPGMECEGCLRYSPWP